MLKAINITGASQAGLLDIEGEFAVDYATYKEQKLYPDKIIDLNEWLSLLNGKALITKAEPLDNDPFKERYADIICISWVPVIALGDGD